MFRDMLTLNDAYIDIVKWQIDVMDLAINRSSVANPWHDSVKTMSQPKSMSKHEHSTVLCVMPHVYNHCHDSEVKLNGGTVFHDFCWTISSDAVAQIVLC